MDSIQWLMEIGGAAIKLNLINEGLIDKNAYDVEKLVDELLQIEKVKTRLTYFDKFKDYESMLPTPYKGLGAYIHNCYEDCYEMFMPFFIKLGFRKGIPVFDEKVEYMREVYRYLMTLGDGFVSPIIMLMLEAGYFYDDMLDYLNRILDKRYNTAVRQCFDIYETDPSKIRYSKLPKQWKDAPILKDIHVDTIGCELPIPTIYQINLMIKIYDYVNDAETKKKIETILEYVMHPEFQKLRGNLGYGWWPHKNTYYACSGTLSLPFYEDNRFSRGACELMSTSSYTANTDCFRKCVAYLEQYKTERGTYMFPDESYGKMATLDYDVFISKDAKVKRNEKRAVTIELLSTYFVMLMKKRMERSK